MIQKVVVDHHKNWTYAKFLSLDSRVVDKAFVKRISALVSFEDRPKDSEVLDFYSFFLGLYDVLDALSNATPSHIEETEGFALFDF